MKLLIVGDFYPGLRVSSCLLNPPEKVFGSFSSLIDESDLAVINLEAPLTDNSYPIIKTGPALRGDPVAGKLLKKAGFDLVTLANNHILDFGKEGLTDTISTLKEENLAFVGAGFSKQEASKPYFIELQNQVVAFVNFAENEWSTTQGNSAGANPVDPINNYHSIKETAIIADHVIVITHGGHEMYQLPSPRMKQLFRFYVEAGASAVINHHPHCTSGYELYLGKPIFYSLGNFLFDHIAHRNNAWNRGMAVSLTLIRNKIDFNIHYFDQCQEEPSVKLCSKHETLNRRISTKKLNNIIQNDKKLATCFKVWVKANNTQYRSYIEPFSNRYLQALQNRALLPSLWSKRKKQYLLNLIRCEAHRDVLLSVLQSEISDT